MTDHFNAFEISPVPDPEDASPPELYRGVYAMPMFVTIPTPDLAASVDFWTRGLGFFDFFTAPGQVTHLRRWAFQDVLLIPADATATGQDPSMSVSFSCVLSEIEHLAAACEELLPGSTQEPWHTPWRTLDLAVRTPENAQVVFTAAEPLVPGGQQARDLAAAGYDVPPELLGD